MHSFLGPSYPEFPLDSAKTPFRFVLSGTCRGCTDHPDICFAPGDAIGWVKSNDIDCSKGFCILKDNYTDAHGGCVNFGMPVYDRPEGKPIGVFNSEPYAGEYLVRSNQLHGYSLLHFDTKSKNHKGFLGPYNKKSLHECG